MVEVLNWKDKNILITGISGFVGSYLAERLHNEGAAVYGIVRRRSDGQVPRNINFHGLSEKVHLLDGNLLDISSLADAITVAEPDYVFHLGSQSYVHNSFTQPIETSKVNCIGTSNLLEAIRFKDLDPVVVFAGSSEEYGLVISSEEQYRRLLKKYKIIFPPPGEIPELPVTEMNRLRPMSPYAVSKVYGEHLMRDYAHSFGFKTIISRGFNHEGAGRGPMFVTSHITRLVMKLKFEEIKSIVIGNINAFRDWSHVLNVIDGYLLLAEKGAYGDVYNQGSERTHSVLSYILLSLELAGWEVEEITAKKGDISLKEPTKLSKNTDFGLTYEQTEVDRLMITENGIRFKPENIGLDIKTDKGIIPVMFEESRFRPSDVPILLADASKIKKLGYKINYSLKDVINSQLNYYLDEKNRQEF